MKAKPFLKWAGGKVRLIPVYKRLGLLPPPGFNKKQNTYYEPFLGDGAVFFDLEPGKAVLSDANRELIRTYWGVKNNARMVAEKLKYYENHNSEGFYYSLRQWPPLVSGYSQDEYSVRAAWFVYLNRAGYRGLYRVNRRGEFDVPWGHYKNPRIVDENNIYAVSEALKHAVIEPSPFQVAVADAKAGDFVYMDPPYYPASRTANFTGYTVDGFIEADHVGLRDVFMDLADRGCLVMLSNSDTEFIRELYKGLPGVNIHQISARRGINNGKATELVITNYGRRGKDT